MGGPLRSRTLNQQAPGATDGSPKRKTPKFAWAQAILKKVEKEGMPPLQADGIPDAQYAKDWVEMRSNQDVVDSLEVMVVRVGDAAFVGLARVKCSLNLASK